MIDEHDAAAVGFDPLEDQLHDAVQQLIDVERVADGQRRAIHDLQIAARRASQGLSDPSTPPGKYAASFGLSDGRTMRGFFSSVSARRYRLLSAIDVSVSSVPPYRSERAANLYPSPLCSIVPV